MGCKGSKQTLALMVDEPRRQRKAPAKVSGKNVHVQAAATKEFVAVTQDAGLSTEIPPKRNGKQEPDVEPAPPLTPPTAMRNLSRSVSPITLGMGGDEPDAEFVVGEAGYSRQSSRNSLHSEPDSETVCESERLQIMSGISWADSVGIEIPLAPSPSLLVTTPCDPCVEPMSITAAVARHAELQSTQLAAQNEAATVVAGVFDNVMKKVVHSASEDSLEMMSTEPEAENMLEVDTCGSLVQSSPGSQVAVSVDEDDNEIDQKDVLKPAVQRTSLDRVGMLSLKRLALCCSS